MPLETIEEIISKLSSNEISTDDGLVTFIFQDKPLKKGLRKLTVRNNEKGETFDGYYKIEELRSEDGYWILEFSYNGISSSVEFFTVDEAIEELTMLDMRESR